MNNIDVVTVVNVLKNCGFSQEEAREMFGLLTGRAFKCDPVADHVRFGDWHCIDARDFSGDCPSQHPYGGESNGVGDADDDAGGVAIDGRLGALAEPIDIMLFKDTQGASVIMALGLRRFSAFN